ncbi:MAG: TSUP family transporter [Bacteroidetes bacterium]|nr:TSUP family transporter [Bacteroidota bacterium]
METIEEKITIEKQETNINKLFPIFLKLEKLKVLIVGGGNVALEKLNAVLANSPETNITIVAPEIINEIFKISYENENVKIKQRVFFPGDLFNADIVIAATGDHDTNKIIKDEAKKREMLVNVADTPELCDFYLGSIVNKGDLKIAVSTNGKSPTLAKRVKEVLNDAIPNETQNVLDNLEVIRKKLNGNFSEKVKKLNEITSVLAVENNIHSLQPHLLVEEEEKPKYKQAKYWVIYSFSAIALMIVGHLLFSYLPLNAIGGYIGEVAGKIDSTLLIFVVGGFLAQMVDGALGMAYGVTATTFLLSFGISPAAASASVHASEIFTTGASGISHLRFKNVNTKLFRNLLIPGILGAILGAYILSSLENYAVYIKPFVSVYTLILGVVIIRKAIRKIQTKKKIKRVGRLAFIGAFLDSIGGGGWGPIVSSTLIARGRSWRYTIGSVNLAEFFVTLASSITFFTVIGIHHWYVIIGLIIGGMIAAPFAAYLTSKIPVRAGLITVGVVVIVVSLRILFKTFF